MFKKFLFFIILLLFFHIGCHADRIENIIKKAEKGDTYAQAQLGCAYLRGEWKLPVNYKKALKWLQLAEAKQHPLALYGLGEMYSKGIEVKIDRKKSALYFKEAFSKINLNYKKYKNQQWRTCLANMYLEGKGTKKDPKKAIDLYNKAVDNNDLYAMGKIGLLYEKGMGLYLKKNLAQAMLWYKKAADFNDPWSQNRIGRLFENGIGVKQDYKKAHEWYLKPADKGYPYAQANIADLYTYGHGVKKDYKTSLKWLNKAISQNNLRAICDMGTMYKHGYGIDQDYKKAFQQYSKAAHLGYTNAQVNLAIMYVNGLGIEKNYEQALRWLQKATAHDNVWAMRYLGGMYESGTGVKKNYTIAKQWYKVAAHKGSTEARKKLIELLGIEYEIPLLIIMTNLMCFLIILSIKTPLKNIKSESKSVIKWILFTISIFLLPLYFLIIPYIENAITSPKLIWTFILFIIPALSGYIAGRAASKKEVTYAALSGVISCLITTGISFHSGKGKSAFVIFTFIIFFVAGGGIARIINNLSSLLDSESDEPETKKTPEEHAPGSSNTLKEWIFIAIIFGIASGISLLKNSVLDIKYLIAACGLTILAVLFMSKNMAKLQNCKVFNAKKLVLMIFIQQLFMAVPIGVIIIFKLNIAYFIVPAFLFFTIGSIAIFYIETRHDLKIYSSINGLEYIKNKKLEKKSGLDISKGELEDRLG